ncbi:MAG: glycosyltransferase [Anaerolineales bacterium]|nr:glycosyltransferase [Anaerolineales bacterium]
MFVIAFAVFAVLTVLTFTATLNTFFFPRLGNPRSAAGNLQSPVSILIPARNESAVIARTVRALLAQDYDRFELLILDDGSTDGTGALALQAAQGDPRVRILTGKPLPTGWLGKNWACHQLAEAATSDFLLFTDADVEWQPGALAALLRLQAQLNADLLTVWPTQRTETWGERLVVPLMALAIIAYLPILAVHHLPWRAFSAAMGQCLLFRREAYARIGGHAAVRSNIVEDVALAARIKGAGLRLRMADGHGLITCRMYRSWDEVRDGFAKNLLAGHGNRPFLLLLSTLFHWLVFVFPWAWLLVAAVGGSSSAVVFPLALVSLGVGVRALSAAVTGQRVRDALFMPASVALMTVIAARSLHWHFTGGPRWKGRVFTAEPPRAQSVDSHSANSLR